MMHRSRVLSVWLAFFLIAAAATGSACLDRWPCVSRGLVTPYSGSITISGPTGTATYPATMNMDDYDPFSPYPGACGEETIEFTVRLGDQCRLWIYATDSTAEVQPNQTCTLIVPSGTLTVKVGRGALGDELDVDEASLTFDGLATLDANDHDDGGDAGVGDAGSPVAVKVQFTSP